MFIFDMSNPLTLLLMLAVTILLIFLSQEVKQSFIGAIMLFAYLIILVVHVAQIATLSEEYRYLLTTLSRCIVIDFIFVLKAKSKGKKSIDNSLDWFWKKI